MSTEKQQRVLKRRPHIVVATPGRLWELITTGEEHFADISSVKYYYLIIVYNKLFPLRISAIIFCMKRKKIRHVHTNI